jgi:23S rRNA (uracil1939-C5)-methyltransferase
MRPLGCADRCPACPHRDLSKEESLARKGAWLRDELAPWRKVIEPIVSPATRWGYRRKALLRARLIEGRWAFGILRRHGREEELVPIPDCPLQRPAVNRLFRLASGLLPAELPVAFGMVSGSAFTLVLKSARNQSLIELPKDRLHHWPRETSFFVNWNPVAGRRALDSRRTELVFGQQWLELDGLVHGPSSFRQQIPEMEKAALNIAEGFLAEAGAGKMVDLFCGLGAGLARWQRHGWQSAGVELSGESLAAAARNAPHSVLYRGRVEERLPQLSEFVGNSAFVLYTNPPRSGHGQEVLAWLGERKPVRIAYLSCHPRSLAGDLETLSRLYAVERIQPLDFFPQTSHLETLALLRG